MLPTTLTPTTRSRLFICALLLTGLLAAGAGVFPASGQQFEDRTVDPGTRADSITYVESTEKKSPGRALAYSIGGTVGGSVLLLPVGGILLGPIVGPSLGHFYANNADRAWRGIYIRGGIVGGTLVFSLATLDSDVTDAETILTLGTLAFLGHAIYDIVTAPGSATDYNDNADVNLQVAPKADVHAKRVGLAVNVTL